jgi:hypothetical protein
MATNFGNFWFFPTKAELDTTGSDDGLKAGMVALVTGDQLYTVESVTATTSTTMRANRNVYSPKYFHDTLSNAAARYPSWISSMFVSSYGGETEAITPFAGKLMKVLLRTVNAAGNTDVEFYRGGSAVATVQLSMSADTVTEFDFDGEDNAFASGEMIGLGMNPSSAPGETCLTAVWEYMPG